MNAFIATGTALPRLSPDLAAYRERVRRFEDDADPCIRGILATRVYRDEPELPVARKRAEIVARVLETIEPIVLSEERLLGAVCRRRRVHGGVSDGDWWRIAVAYPDYRGFNGRWPVPESILDELRWWASHPPPSRPNPARERHAYLGRYGLASPHGYVSGHTLPDHGILLTTGVGGLSAQVAERLAGEEEQSQRDELLAMARILQGLSTYCRRCAEFARRKAAEVDDPRLCDRLLTAAADCEHVAEFAPNTLPRALQLVTLSNFTDLMDSPGDAASYGRIDQLLVPFYEADLAAGRLTHNDAFEWICHLVAKTWCVQSSINMTVGGVKPDGSDATNDISTMLLEAMETLEMTTDISVRLHAGSPDAFVRTAARVIRRGLGRPSLYNDDVTIPALVRNGVDVEDARDYAPLGCVEVMIPGRSSARTMCMGLCMPKVLELVLNRGRCLVTGDDVWDDVPADFATYDELHCEFRKRIRQVVDAGVEIIRGDEMVEPTVYPRPWLTVLSRGGIEAATDMTAGQPKYNPAGVTLDGIADIADSLHAVARIVFAEERVSLDELRAILASNWDGHEPLRQYVLKGLPRHGQDAPVINRIVRDETGFFADCFEPHRTYWGGRFWPMVFGVTTSFVNGRERVVGATPAGRRREDHLAISFQPSAGVRQGCISELLNSITAVDFVRFPGGVSNVEECDPTLFEGEPGITRLVNLVEGFFNAGGMELSLNFIDEATLRKAQHAPDQYRFLMVRLFGLSAQFVNLSETLQQTVIERVSTASKRTL